jgi:hypothetical protein
VPGEVFVGRLKDGVEVEEGAEREEKDAIGASAAALARWLVARLCEVVGLLGYTAPLGKGKVWGVVGGSPPETSAGCPGLLAAPAGLVSKTGWFGLVGSSPFF